MPDQPTRFCTQAWLDVLQDLQRRCDVEGNADDGLKAMTQTMLKVTVQITLRQLAMTMIKNLKMMERMILKVTGDDDDQDLDGDAEGSSGVMVSDLEL